MEHIFIVNPTAGNGKGCEKLIRDIGRERAGRANVHIFVTEGAKMARSLVEDWCGRSPEVRFYACGGDGTLQVVAAAAAGQKNAEVGMIPIGTGNDFVRNFKTPRLFLDIGRQIQGIARPVDLIEYRETEEGFCTYGINMINIGFDSDVAAEMQKNKRHMVFGGKRAYLFGVARTLLRKMGKEMEVTADGERLAGEFLLTAAANGRFCGGGFMAAPEALLSDGALDLQVIGKVGRMRFLSLVGKYRSGTYLKCPAGRAVAEVRRCREIKIVLAEQANIAIDGEIRRAKTLLLRPRPGLLRFSAPVSCWEGVR